MAEWTRVATTTTRKYLKGYEAEVFRNRAVLALLKKKGRIVNNVGGDGIQWQVEYRQTPMQQNNHEQTLTFARQDAYKNAYLTYRGYGATDAIYDRELELNKGPEALVNVFENLGKRLSQTLEEQFPDKLFGSDVTNTGDITGLESMFGTTGTNTIATASGTRSANAADYVGWPTATYAGLVCTLGNYTGSLPAAGWPLGVVAQPGLDFWSPLVVNYESTAFGGAAATFAQQCVQALRFGITHSKRNKSKRGDLDLILLDRDLYRQFKDKWDPIQRINVDKNDGMVSLGFKDVMSIDGVEVMSDYSVPAPLGYGINADFMTLYSTKDTLFELKGPFYDEESQANRYMARYFGNLVCQSPRHFCKFTNINSTNGIV